MAAGGLLRSQRSGDERTVHSSEPVHFVQVAAEPQGEFATALAAAHREQPLAGAVNGVSSHPCSCEQAHREYAAARWALLSESVRD